MSNDELNSFFQNLAEVSAGLGAILALGGTYFMDREAKYLSAIASANDNDKLTGLQVQKKLIEKRKWQCYILACLFGALIPLSNNRADYYSTKELEAKELKSAKSGTFYSEDSDGFRHVFEDGRSAVRLQIGDSESQLFIGAPGGTVIGVGDETGLGVKEINGQLFVSFIVRNKRGEIVAEMTENEWELNEKNYYKRNYDKSALEVIDDKGMVIFQIEVLSDRIKMQGKLFTGAGRGIAFYSRKDGGAAIQGIDSISVDSILIDPMFKYPSSKFFGIRID
ncbi:hypothetical protein [Dyadobacter sp. OTU695]|uniref:hypothetical protein n=1 Tax=Dyadobacter sp. OTU695 TaxID=3043860 RepID=UPI00313CDD20